MSYVDFTQCMLHSKKYTGLLPLAINHIYLYILSIIYQSHISTYSLANQSCAWYNASSRPALILLQQKVLGYAKPDICQSPNSLAMIFSANEYGPLYTPLIVFGIYQVWTFPT